MPYADVEWGAGEIVLWINNEQPYYNQKIAQYENLEKKVAKGTYNRDLALKMFKHLTDRVRKDWNKKFAADQGETIPVASSRLADKELREDFERSWIPYDSPTAQARFKKAKTDLPKFLIG